MNPYSGPGPARMGASLMTLAGPTGATSATGIAEASTGTAPSTAVRPAAMSSTIAGADAGADASTGTGADAFVAPGVSTAGSVAGATVVERAGSSSDDASTGTASSVWPSDASTAIFSAGSDSGRSFSTCTVSPGIQPERSPAVTG